MYLFDFIAKQKNMETNVKAESMRDLMKTILQINSTFRAAIQRSLRKNDVVITFEMLQVMVQLWINDGVNQQELADKTFKDKGSLTNLLNNLESKNFVKRQEDTNDRRNKKIVLSMQGHDLQKVIDPLLVEIYASAAKEMELHSILETISLLEKTNDAFKKID